MNGSILRVLAERLAILGLLAIGAFSVQACLNGGGGGSGGAGSLPVRQFTSWADVNPGEVVVINGEVVHADYETNLATGDTNADPSERTDGEARLTYDNAGMLERVDIDAGDASVDFNENDGDDIGLVFADLVGGAISQNGQEVGLWAEPAGLGFNYQTFGVWLTGYNTGAGVAAAGSFGAMTPAADVPTLDVATYNGAASGFAVDGTGTPFFVVSDAEVVLDFDDGTFTFATINSVKDDLVDANELDFANDAGFNLDGAGNIVDNNLEGNVETTGYDMAGDIEAWLYGPGGAEVGGLFDLEGTDGRYAGSFGAVD